MRTVNSAYFSPPHVILAIAEVFNCGLTNPETYLNDGHDAGIAASSVRHCREDFARRVPLGLAYARPNRRFVEIATPTYTTASPNDDDDDDTLDAASDDEAPSSGTAAYTHFWTDLTQTQSTAYEGAVERFFRHPHIEAVYARMMALEQDEMQSEFAFVCDAFTQGFQPHGYVYVAWNALFGHLLKIGFTMRTPALRLRELRSEERRVGKECRL